MMLNDAQVTLLFKTISTRFVDLYQKTTVWSEGLFGVSPESTDTIEVFWVEVIPQFEKWLKSQKTWNGVNARGYQAHSEPWHDSLLIDRRKTLVDQMRVLPRAVDNLARNTKKFYDRLFKTCLQRGKTGGSTWDLVSTFDPYLWYDGKAAFASDHPVNIDDSSLGVWSNLRKGSPLTTDNLDAAIEQGGTILLPNGDPMGVNFTHLIVSSGKKRTGLRLTETDMIGRLVDGLAGSASQENNITKMKTKNNYPLELVVADDLSNEPGVWYLMDRSEGREAVTCWQVQGPRPAPNNGIPMPNNAEMYFSQEAHAGMAISNPPFIQRNEP